MKSPAATFLVGDRLPVSLSREQLAGIIGKSLSQFDALRKQHRHPAIKELLPRTGHPRFSGAVAQAWLDGQAAGDARRFFASHRKVRSVSPRLHARQDRASSAVCNFKKVAVHD